VCGLGDVVVVIPYSYTPKEVAGERYRVRMGWGGFYLFFSLFFFNSIQTSARINARILFLHVFLWCLLCVNVCFHDVKMMLTVGNIV
jgi:hypothetical protein